MRLELRNVGKIYHKEAVALQDISLTLSPGDRMILRGESGAGKSTLLRLLGLIDRDFSGEYYIDGKNSRDFHMRELSKLRNQAFGFIFQEFALIEDDTVFENVKIPLLYSNKRKWSHKKEVEKLLEKVGLEEFMDKKVRNLSGGQRQRVAVARALINRPDVIIADEPTASLGVRDAQQVLQTLYDYLDETKILVMATHDLKEIKMENKKLLLAEGKICT
ncbi:ABC transporter ATP-binding protein [Acetivibrio ethanolgignens]|uniref:ABC transporter domain-containing protein n=1 Tax=Acetivibrio ethanolgignens TaxID=290052 RepID=A0A0V8QHD0_9FIRM|nr:ABC transporter ATP-binding protein [Acetivibrio ethanolgignens]KSV59870.1 hypothetical protein ASU35_07660 [Acetivibrio ethanolgignens]